MSWTTTPLRFSLLKICCADHHSSRKNAAKTWMEKKGDIEEEEEAHKDRAKMPSKSTVFQEIKDMVDDIDKEVLFSVFTN